MMFQNKQQQQQQQVNNISKMMARVCVSSKAASSLSSFVALVLVTILINISCVRCSMDEESPSNLEAKVGSYVVFDCEIDFPHDLVIPYAIYWSKDDKRIFSKYFESLNVNELFSGRLSLVENHEDYGHASLNLSAIRESDHGWYHCLINFPNRTPSFRNNGTWHHLTVQGGSLIKIPPVNVTLMEGQTALFHCSMKHPEYSTITWLVNGTDIRQNLDLSRRSKVDPGGSLSIDPTMYSDWGDYACNVKNDVNGEIQKANAYLNIHYKAKVTFTQPEVYLPYGQSAILDCAYRANPPLKNMHWEKDGLLFDSYNVPGVFKKPNGSLFFSKVDENFSGAYTCTPYNELGSDGPSMVISVIVRRPPVFTTKPRELYIHKLGEDALLSCDAIDRDDFRRPQIIWTKEDNSALPEERINFEGGNMTIKHITEADRGIYLCSATNDASTITAKTELVIENVAPRPPYNLTANSTQSEITLRWQPGQFRPNLEYTVMYRILNSPEWRIARVGSKVQATIRNLKHSCEYEFMVLSQDPSGDGMFSRTFQYATKPDFSQVFEEPEHLLEPAASTAAIPQFVDIGPPKYLTVLPKSDGYLVRWDEPTYGADLLRMYRLKVWLEPEHALYIDENVFNTYFLLKNLEDNTHYSAQVFSVSATDEEYGSNSVRIEVQNNRRKKAVLIGSAVSVIFLITAFSVGLYVKRICIKKVKSNGDKMGG